MGKMRIAGIIVGALLLIIGVGLFQVGSNLMQEMSGRNWELARLFSYTAQRAYQIAETLQNSGVFTGVIGFALIAFSIFSRKKGKPTHGTK